MLKDKLTIATHITRKSSPWVGMAAMFLIAATDLKK
jgi:hypothetical protein